MVCSLRPSDLDSSKSSSASKLLYGVRKLSFPVTSGRFSYTLAIPSTWKIHGKVFFKVDSWLQWVEYPIIWFNSHSCHFQAYKHVFLSPSSVDKDAKAATRSGNARIHGMTSVTCASIAYIATQVNSEWLPPNFLHN